MNKLTKQLGRVIWGKRDSSEKPESARPGLRGIRLAGTWVDVGAHLGETTFQAAQDNPNLEIYAFEPNLKLASQRWAVLTNFIVLPFAVAEIDGFVDFYLNANDSASSLLPFIPEGLRQWAGGESLRVESKVRVPSTRLDTFMNRKGISKIEYLKVDAQGADLAVIRSAGERIRDIKKISLEVAIAPMSLYEGACRRSEILSYLGCFGFTLSESETQSYHQEENLTFISGVAT